LVTEIITLHENPQALNPSDCHFRSVRYRLVDFFKKVQPWRRVTEKLPTIYFSYVR